MLVLILLSSCYRKTTCPAFQTKYILDEQVLNRKYSLFEADSLPKNGLGKVNKNRNGIHASRSYNVKFNEIKNVEMVTIYPESQEAILVANYGADSLSMDSVLIPSKRYLTTFNNEQLIYNSLFGSLRKPQRDGMELFKDDFKVETNEEAGQEEEKVGFFKRLFGNKRNDRGDKKKEKAEFGDPDEEDLEPPEDHVEDGN
ncbi:MAG: hypothetical protein KFF73_16380 [Cyclobacteriaceae bacterium]|nr:hypothetical protein [Cyclobacteriaceae bacterium]